MTIDIENKVVEYRKKLEALQKLDYLDTYTQMAPPLKIMNEGRVHIRFVVNENKYELCIMHPTYNAWTVGGWSTYYAETVEQVENLVLEARRLREENTYD